MEKIYDCVLFKRGNILIKAPFCLKVVNLTEKGKVLDNFESSSIDGLVDIFINKGWSLNKTNNLTTIPAPYIKIDLDDHYVPVGTEVLYEFYLNYYDKKPSIEVQNTLFYPKLKIL